MPLAHQLGVPWGDTKRPPPSNSEVEEMLVDDHVDVSLLCFLNSILTTRATSFT
ncbi:hypothetical protein Ocin01_02910 [Orchesella cincta]|uniref:Uncharacterized protein n=1 Tax=Orchesella cincta TaxID=48709 RepID=A0A1D2NF94_ORCCI|nr:hypothetical protein Ocin01_02910 [Orchesella cincta]